MNFDGEYVGFDWQNQFPNVDATLELFKETSLVILKSNEVNSLPLRANTRQRRLFSETPTALNVRISESWYDNGDEGNNVM